MRIVIVNAFERGNRGDAALLSAMIAQAREAYPESDIGICGFESPAVHAEFDGARNLGSMRRYTAEEGIGRINRISRKLLVASVAAAVAVGLGRPLARGAGRLLPAEVGAELTALARADVVISLGGGYLRGGPDFPSDLSVAFLLLPLWISQRLRVPVVSAPQSYGPFPTRFQRWAARTVLSRNTVVSSREGISTQMLEELGVPRRIVRQDVDSAFAFSGGSDRPWRRELGLADGEMMVLMTARQYLKPAAQAAYEEALAKTILHILNGDERTRVVLAPQVTCAFQEDDDRIVSRRIAQLAAHPRLLLVDDDTISHHDIMALYSAADFMVGTRFHSVIFSLLAHVPCIAVSYERKGRGIMRDLGLEKWVIDMADVDAERLIALVDDLMAEPSYRSQLETAIPAYRSRAQQFVDVLRAAPAGAAT